MNRRNRVTLMLTDGEFEALTRMADREQLPLGTVLYNLVRRRLRPSS
jgi:hypothetical protein